MSLDIYLEGPTRALSGSGIFIRENGPAYKANITHNLGKMADAAGIYEHLWRPDEIGVTHAEQLIHPLTVGLAKLRAEPDKFKALNPPNGWGDYDGLVGFVAGYLAACQAHPAATVRVWR